MNIAAILEDHARRFGERTAIVEGGRRISFAELNRAAVGAAEDLAGAGLRCGMRALVFSPMSIDLYATVVAMFRLGVTAVFVDPSAGSATLAACIARVRPDAFAGIPRAHLLRLTSSAIREIPIKITMPSAFRRKVQRADGAPRPLAACDASSPAIITFTSATSGQPKAAVRTHGFLLAQYRAVAETLRLEAGDRDFTTLPIFALANLAAGVTSVIPDMNGSLLDQLLMEGAHRTVASPALLERLAENAAASGRRLDTLRTVYTGGGPVFPKVLDAIANLAPRATVVAVYGSTEAEPIATLDLRDISPADRRGMHRGAGLLAGRPVPSIDVRLLPDRWGSPIALTQTDFERAVLGPGCHGEIVVAGEHVLSGYLDGVGDEDTKLKAGDRIWHRTGDAGYFDAHGRLWLLGRCDAKVTDAAGTLYPLAVECAASSVPGVRRSALVRHRGRRVLVVESHSGNTAETRKGADRAPALRDTLLRRLRWAAITDVILVSRMPMDRRHNAKVDLTALRVSLAVSAVSRQTSAR